MNSVTSKQPLGMIFRIRKSRLGAVAGGAEIQLVFRAREARAALRVAEVSSFASVQKSRIEF